MINIENLNLIYKNHHILKNINLNIKNGKTLGIIGQSGSGKSMFVRTLINLLGNEFVLNASRFEILGKKVLSFSKKELVNYRKFDVGLIFQNAGESFHPLYNIGDIFITTLKNHYKDVKEIKKIAFETFFRLGFDDVELLWHSFPMQISGGMLARVQIALNLCMKQKLLICDEITSSLDSINAQNIIDILKELKNELNFIIITHDPYVVYELADEICVFDSGSIIETNSKFEIFTNPKKELTKEILCGKLN